MLSLTVSLLAFAGSLDCDRQMERGGAMIMGAIPLVSSRSIVVTRGSPSGEALHSGAAYRHGDKLYVTLDSDEGQAQIRASGGALFAYPYNQLGLAGEPLTCIGKHPPEEGHPEHGHHSWEPSLLMPAEATGEIEIWAGHASTYGAISVTDKFVLRAARGRSTSSRFGGSFAGAFGASLTVLVAAAASWRRTRGCSGRLALGHAGERFGSKQAVTMESQ